MGMEGVFSSAIVNREKGVLYAGRDVGLTHGDPEAGEIDANIFATSGSWHMAQQPSGLVALSHRPITLLGGSFLPREIRA